jgi:predicted Zn-dependent peptidase
MMMMGRSVLDRGRVPSLEEIFTSIQDTSAAKIQQMAQQMFNPAKLSYLKMIPN